MQIGVLGSGVTAQTIGTKLIQLGHEVMLGSRAEANPPAVVK
jgi:predicted dinucleotide-binding enzyme